MSSGSAKPLNPGLVHEAIEMRKKGRTQVEIAVELRVAQGTVSKVLRAHGWGGHLVRKATA